MKEHSLLVEKYRPDNLEGYVGNENIKKVIAQYLTQNDIQNLIFYGPAGTGKTTLAKIIINNLDCDHLYINASDERGIETIREKVTGFASVASFKPLKVVILDEADFLTIQAQASLRNIIETFSRTTRFIMTCNFVERIIDPLQSRCQVLKIVPPTKSDVAKHLVGILDAEKIGYTLENINLALNFFKSSPLPKGQIISGPDQDDADSIISSAALRFYSRNNEIWKVPKSSQKEGWIFGV